MALDFFDKEAVRQALVEPNDPTPSAAAELLFRLDRIQEAVDELDPSGATAEDIANALQTE